jgi:hypothetical protein
MNEHDFLKKLQQRATEQEKIMSDMPFAHAFTVISTYLGVHPWRILIPIAFAITILLQISFGETYDNLVLRILGGNR